VTALPEVATFDLFGPNGRGKIGQVMLPKKVENGTPGERTLIEVPRPADRGGKTASGVRWSKRPAD
jgi:hypothetical protein